MAISASAEAIGRLARYAEILASEAVEIGSIGPREVDRIVPRHMLESCALAPLLPDRGPIIDIGAGAGLPGIPLACLRTDRVTLLESSVRRSSFIRRVVHELDLTADVVEGRAEEVARSKLRDSFVGAVCRALASPAAALELCLPFVAVAGRFVTLITPAGIVSPRAENTDRVRVSADSSAGDDARAAAIGDTADIDALAPVAALLGGGRPELRPLEVPGADASRWAMIVLKLEPTPDRFPRRTGVPARRPLG